MTDSTQPAGVVRRLSSKLASRVGLWRRRTRQRLKDIRAGIWKKRSPLWDEVRDEFLRKEPRCAACGATDNLDVHHRRPFHLFPDAELKLSNLVTLCMGPCKCHLKIGHSLPGVKPNWKLYNPAVDADIRRYRSEHSIK